MTARESEREPHVPGGMTPAQRAVACTSISKFSGLPKWDFLPGAFITSAFGEDDDRYLDPGRLIATEVLRGRVYLSMCTVRGDLVQTRAEWMVPDFADELTVHGMIALVRRAWKGHEVRVASDRVEASATGADGLLGRVLKHRVTILDPDGGQAFDGILDDLGALLVVALELAPER